MIDIRMTDTRMEIRGHAGFEERGKDIICAAVSILAYTFINVYNTKLIEYDVDSIVAEYSKDIDKKFILKGFQLINEQYPNYIRLHIE